MTFTKLLLAATIATTFTASASAGTQTVDAGSYTFSYDDSFWAGAVSKVGNVFTFANLADQGYSANTRGTNIGSYASFGDYSYAGVVVKAKAGNQISSIDTSFAGTLTYTLPNKPDAYVSYDAYAGTSWKTNKGDTDRNSSGSTSGTLRYDTSPVGSGQIGISATDAQNGLFLAGTTIATGEFYAVASVSAYKTGTKIDLTYDTVSFAVAVTAVPEPESYAMLLAGLGLMGFVARRRMAKQG